MLVNGSLFNLVNMVKMDNWLFTIDNRLMVNLDPRLRHSGTSSTLLFGVYLLIRDPRLRHSRTSFAVLRYIYRIMAVSFDRLRTGHVSLLANILVF